MSISGITNTTELLAALKSVKNDSDLREQKLRYVIYARKSTDSDDKQTQSIPDQIAQCYKFAKEHDLAIVAEPIQESESAKEAGIRPKFYEMIKNIELNRYDGIIAWHPDRLARNMKDAGLIIDLIDRNIIKSLKFASFTFENNPSGKMLLGITFVLSKQYSDQLSVNVSRGIDSRIEAGKLIGKTKLGYYKDNNDFLRPDGNNFLLIKESFRMRLEGKSLEEIARFLSRNNLSRRNRENGEYSILRVQKQTVQKIFRDSVYAGVLQYGEGRDVDLTSIYDFSPAVTVEDFLTINSIDKGSSITKLKKLYSKKSKSGAILMKGRVLCDYCKHPKTSLIQKKKNKNGSYTSYYYFRCDQKGCKRKGEGTRAKVIVDFAKKFLASAPFNLEKLYSAYIKELREKNPVEVAQLTKSLNSLKTQISNLKVSTDSLEKSYASEDNPIMKERLKESVIENTRKLNSLHNEVHEIKEKQHALKHVEPSYDEFIKLWENTAQRLDKTNKLKEIDTILKNIFLNFIVNQKNVVSYSLSTPFDELLEPKVSQGGR